MNRMVAAVAGALAGLCIVLVLLYLWGLRVRPAVPSVHPPGRGGAVAGAPGTAESGTAAAPKGEKQMPVQGPDGGASRPAKASLPPSVKSTLVAPPSPPLAPGPTAGAWQPVGLSGGGSMYTPAISPLNPNLMMLNCDMSGAYITTDGGHNWRMINGTQLGGNTRCSPCWSPTDLNTIYAASGWSGHLEVSHDCGRTWSAIGDLKGGLEGAIAIDAGLKSRDRSTAEGGAQGGPPDFMATAPERFLVGTRRGVEMSSDGAQTFHPCSGVTGTALGFCFDQTSALDPAHRVCFIGTDEGIWRSDDGGARWVKKMQGLPEDAGSKVRPLLDFAGGSSPFLHPTMPQGQATAPDGPTIRLYCSVRCSLSDGQLIGGIYRSEDRGESWVSIMNEGINRDTKQFDQYGEGEVPQYVRVLTTDANPNIVYAMNTSTGFWPPHQPTAFRSDDAGAHWRATLFMDPRFKGQYNVDWDYHTAVMHQSYQEGAEGAAIAPNDPNTLIRVGSMEGYITHDGGKSWFPAHTRLAPGQKPEADAAFECNGLVVTTTWHYFIDPFKPNIHYICYTDIGFARSEDSGKTWRWWSETERPPWSNTTYDLAFDPNVPGKIWGAFSNVHDIPNANSVVRRASDQGAGGVALSTDFGVSWKPTPGGLPDAPVTSIVVDPKSREGRRTLYCTVYGVGLFKSTDDGKSWVSKSKGLGSAENMRLYRVLLHPDGTLFCVITGKQVNRKFLEHGAGVYRSKDGGESWQSMNVTQPMPWPKDITLDPADSNILYVGLAGSYGSKIGGLFRTQDGGATWQKLADEGP
ncbi:MAG: hypothetical protein ACREJ2_14970, partial [Planctomycetota bacterium]